MHVKFSSEEEERVTQTSSLSLSRTRAICAGVGLSSLGGVSGCEEREEVEENVQIASNRGRPIAVG